MVNNLLSFRIFIYLRDLNFVKIKSRDLIKLIA